MAAKQMIDREWLLIQQSLHAIKEYESKKAEIQADFERGTASAKSTWESDKSLNENNWNKTRTQTTKALDAARDVVKSSQEAFKKALKSDQWQALVAGGTVHPLVIQPWSRLTEQMTTYQRAIDKTGRQISLLLDSYSLNSQIALAIEISGSIAAVIMVLIITAVHHLFDFSSSGFITLIACFFIFISILLLLFSIIKPLQIRRLLSQAKAPWTMLWSYFPEMERFYQDRIREEEASYHLSAGQIDQTYQRQLAQCQAQYDEACEYLRQTFQQQLYQFTTDVAAFMKELGFSGTAWDETAWDGWRPENGYASVARVGEYRVTSHPGLPAIPALIGSPGEENLIFKAAGSAKQDAINAVQSLMLRILATQAPGKVRFTLIDPVGLGQNVAAFMQLADYDEALVGSRAWTEPRHIEQRLADLSEHMENVIQKYLRNQYTTIEEYNAMAGEVAEPYRVLVIIGFPVKFTEDAARRLIEIATNGPRCGVTTLIVLDTEQALPRDFNLAELERVATIIEMGENRYRGWDFENAVFSLDTLPPLTLFNRIVNTVGKTAQTASEVKVPFDRVAPIEQQWWTWNTREGLKVPLGRVGATKLQYLELGKGTSQHVLVVGKTGSGKTTLLHVLITNIALMYSPDEIELYLVDFKTVGFTAYATYSLPHARVIATQSEREFGLSVLQGLDAELKRRKELLSTAGVQDIGQYRSIKPHERMPRILLLVDEFQEFFTQDDEIAQQAGLLLDRLVRQGRGFGMHVMLGSQTLAGAYSLARATIGQMAVRIALQCEESDSRLILSDDNPAARLLSRPGEAIYNAANGMIEGNNPFQCAWLPDEELDSRLERIQTFARHRYQSPQPQIVFEGNALAEVKKNVALETALSNPYQSGAPGKSIVWLGDAIAIKDPTSVQFRSQAGSNLLIVGQQEETALSMFVAGLYSLAAQYAPGTTSFAIVDYTSSDVAHPGLFTQIGQSLPHEITLVNRRGLPSLLTRIYDEVQSRLEHDEIRKAPIYLFLFGLQRARDLRQEESFGFANLGSEDETPPSLAKQFSTILREGPELGIHTLTWCDSLPNLHRILERSALREFDMRVIFQMSPDDSMNLIESIAGSKLGYYRALLFNEEDGRLEKFRPYRLPEESWRQWATGQLCQKSGLR